MLSTKQYLNLVESEILNHNVFISNNDLNLEVIQVQYCKTIQNHKGLFIVKNEYDYIYPYFIEATYNGDNKELYLDFYTKEFKKMIYVNE